MTETTSDSPPPRDDFFSMIGQGEYSCVFRPSIKCDDTIENTEDSKYYITKLSLESKTTTNELYIGEIIKTIKNYFHYYAIIESNCEANVHHLLKDREYMFEKCNLLKNNIPGVAAAQPPLAGVTDSSEPAAAAAAPAVGGEAENEEQPQAQPQQPPPLPEKIQNKFIYNKILYIGHRDLYDYFNDFIDLNDIDLLIEEIKDKYNFLKHSVKKLNDAGILHYDLKANNVMMHYKYNTPFIIDFGVSCHITKILEKVKIPTEYEEVLKFSFYKFQPDYQVWCYDIMFISYLINNRDSGGVSESLRNPVKMEDIETSCRAYIDNTKLFKYFKLEDDAKTEYYNTCISFYKVFVDKPAVDVIIEIIEKFWKTWDYFSLAVVFGKFVYATDLDILREELNRFISADPTARIDGIEKPAAPVPAPVPAAAPAPAPEVPTPAPSPAPASEVPTPAPAPAPASEVPTPAPAPAPEETAAPVPAAAPAPEVPAPTQTPVNPPPNKLF